MRVIIRFSLDGDDGTLTSALNSVLKRNRLPRKSGTGSYEGSGIDVNVDSLKRALDEFLDKISEQKKAKLDHFWMYVDKEPSQARKKTQSQEKSTQLQAKMGNKE